MLGEQSKNEVEEEDYHLKTEKGLGVPNWSRQMESRKIKKSACCF
jgi:hypothetical protein